MALARLSLLKSNAFLKTTETTFDADYKALLESASRWISSYTSRQLELTTHEDEQYTGDDTRKLWLRETPVTEIDKVEIWDGTEWDEETAANYQLIRELYILYPSLEQSSSLYANWPSSFPEGIRITYTAGYPTADWAELLITEEFGVPEDLEYATAAVAHISWVQGKKGGARRGLTSMTIGNENITIAETATLVQGLPQDVLSIINRYRRLEL